jgi:hypothetical protein
VNRFRSFQEDDENDTRLFIEAEQHVLEHHSNPDRVGCPDPATLRRFVDSPGDVDLSEMNDLHVMQCAECTRDLMELRRERVRSLEGSRTVARSQRIKVWNPAAIAASIVLTVFSVLLFNRNRPVDSGPLVAEQGEPVLQWIDLSGDGVVRGADESSRAPILLPARELEIHLRLPYFSPPGTYRVMLTERQDITAAVASAISAAVVDGSHTDLHIMLDLRRIARGNYFLGTQRLEGQTPVFYPVTIK